MKNILPGQGTKQIKVTKYPRQNERQVDIETLVAEEGRGIKGQSMSHRIFCRGI